MAEVHYKYLAGDYYRGTDKLTGIGPRVVHNVKNTFAIPSVWDTFTGFHGPKQNRSFSSKVNSGAGGGSGDVKVKVQYREPFHSFKYFEALGSFYGMHEIINEKEDLDGTWQEIREKWKSEPAYIDRYDRLRNSSPLKYNNSSNDLSCISLLATVESGKVDFGFQQSIKHDEDKKPYLEIHIGEFHLLPNTPRSIFRCNLSTDLLYIKEGIDHFIADEKIKSEVLNFPDQSVTSNSPVEFYMGIAALGSKNRPRDFNLNNLDGRHPNYIEAGAQIRWKSLSDRCSAWVRIYDGLDMSRVLSTDVYRNSHYVLNTKVIIRLDKLEELILAHGGVDHSTYKILVHLPSYSLLGYDMVKALKEPRAFMILSDISEVKFDVPRNYKTNGGNHYILKIYDTDKETLLFSDSTDTSIDIYKNPKIDVELKRGKWRVDYVNTNSSIGPGDIPFNSSYKNNTGIPIEQYGTMIYTLSESLSKYLKDKEKVYASIEAYDGTRQNNG